MGRIIKVAATAHEKGTQSSQSSQKLVRKTIHNSLDAVLNQPFHVEVDQQAYFTSCEPKVRQHLSTVNWLKALDCFCFHHDQILDEEVESISNIHRVSPICHWHQFLALESKPSVDEFERQARLVRGLEQAWPEGSMDFNSGGNDLFGEVVQLIFHAAPGMQDHCGFSRSPCPSARFFSG